MTDSLVMYALFALDAYNEDPATAQLNVTLNEDQLGDATLLNKTNFLPVDYQSTGFFATAYDWNGQTVISYRGTLTQIFGTEVWNGYTTGAGFPFDYQADDAIQFFQTLRCTKIHRLNPVVPMPPTGNPRISL